MAEVVNIARCPEHGLHGCRHTCFECGAPVEQVPMVHLDALGEAREAHEMDMTAAQAFIDAATKRAEAAEAKLESLRSACKQWRRETEALNARQGLVLVASDRALFDALDASEDTSGGGGS